MAHTTSRDGTRISWDVVGSGPPLVLVHGTTATGARWTPILGTLQQRFTIHAIYRRGRAESGDAPAYAIEREFEDVAAVVDAIGQPINLLGHSFGAICALEATLLTPNVRKLVLYEPPVPTPGAQVFPPGSFERLQAYLEAGDRDGLLTFFFREINRMPAAHFDQLRASPVWAARLALAHTLPREIRAVDGYRFAPQRFANLQTPVLLLLGGDSPPYFGAAIDAIAAALPQAQKIVLPGQTHIAIDTAPDLFAAEVVRFLSE